MICIGHNQHAVAPHITKSIFVCLPDGRTWVIIKTLTDEDVENILNIRNYQVIPKNVIENSFIVLREYARAKSKPINELENLPQVEIVRNF